MSTTGWSSGGRYRENLTWGDARRIYEARFRKLLRVLKLSVSATIIAVGTVILLPVMLGIAVFSAHFFLTVMVVVMLLLVSAWLYWKSLKLAFGAENR